LKKQCVFAISMVLLVSAVTASSAFAQEKTPAEVTPIVAQQAAQLNQHRYDDMGAGISGSSAAGQREVAGKTGFGQGNSAMAACVGPVSFCTPYFGS
jgi:hypothetical protein